ncbi:MAG: N-acetylmuramoyl-L-alanine amidase [Desulfovibrio sp.]
MELKAEDVKYIVVHCSATPPDMDIGVAEIDQWHRERGWKGCGYHAVIRRNGALQPARFEDEVGAHCKGFNRKSFGICLVGGVDEVGDAEFNFTQAQMSMLSIIIPQLQRKFPNAVAVGHRDLNPYKDCPCFEVDEYVKYPVRR